MAVWVIAIMAFCIPPSVLALRSLRLDNEVTTWIAQDNPAAEAFRWYDVHFPAEDTILFTWDGSSLTDPRVTDLVNRISGKVDAEGVRRGGSKLVERVRTPHELLANTDGRSVPRSEAMQRLQGVLIGGGPLRVQLTAAGRRDVAGSSALVESVATLAAGVPVKVSRAVPLEDNEPGQLVAVSMSSLRKLSNPQLADPLVLAYAGTTTQNTTTGGTAGNATGRATDNAASDATTETATTDAAAAGDAALKAGNDAASDNAAVPVAGDNAAIADAGAVTDDSAAEESLEHDLLLTWPGQQTNRSTMLRVAEALLAVVGTPAAGESTAPTVVSRCFLIPGSPVGIAFTLSEAGQADRGATFKELQRIAVECGIPAETIHMGGRAIASTALNQEVLKAVWNTDFPITQPFRRSVIGVSWLVGLALAFWILRSVRLSCIVLAVSYFTVLVSTALVPLSGGGMNMVLVVMPTLLMVTSLSGAIHLSNYWKHAAAHNPRTAVKVAVDAAWTPTVWACLTTAIGLASLLTSTLTPVRDFGVYSAVGTIITMFVVLFGLPSLLHVWPGTAGNPAELDPRSWRVYGGHVVRRWKPIAATVIAVSIVCTLGLLFFKTETKVIRYFADHLRIVRDYQAIENELTGIIPLEIVVRFDTHSQEELKFTERLELVRSISEQVRLVPDVSGALCMADFLPVTKPLSEKPTARERLDFATRSRVLEGKVRRGEQGISQLVRYAPDASDYNAAGDELWRISCQAAVMSPRYYGDLTSELNEICKHVLRGIAGRDGDKFRKENAVAHYHPGASHYVTGMVPMFMATQDALLSSLLNSFLLAFVTIGVVMMFLMRSVPAGLLLLLPNVLPIGTIFGLISWCGLAVDVGTIVTASVALGIAVDGTLHMVTWFRNGLENGLSRGEAVVESVTHCGPAMWQTSLTVALGLVMLCPADLVLISRFGWLMSMLLIGALIADVTLTPALLAGPLGYLLERIVQEKRAAAASVDEDRSEAEMPSTVSVRSLFDARGNRTIPSAADLSEIRNDVIEPVDINSINSQYRRAE